MKEIRTINVRITVWNFDSKLLLYMRREVSWAHGLFFLTDNDFIGYSTKGDRFGVLHKVVGLFLKDLTLYWFISIFTIALINCERNKLIF